MPTRSEPDRIDEHEPRTGTACLKDTLTRNDVLDAPPSRPEGRSTARPPLSLIDAASPSTAAEGAVSQIVHILHTNAPTHVPGQLLAEALLVFANDLSGHCTDTEADDMLLTVAAPLLRELLILADTTGAGALGLLALALAAFQE